jgi:hypothetical protein
VFTRKRPTHVHLGLPSGLLPSNFFPETYVHFSSPPYLYHMLHPSYSDLIVITVFGEEYKS